MDVLKIVESREIKDESRVRSSKSTKRIFGKINSNIK